MWCRVSERIIIIRDVIYYNYLVVTGKNYFVGLFFRFLNLELIFRAHYESGQLIAHRNSFEIGRVSSYHTCEAGSHVIL